MASNPVLRFVGTETLETRIEKYQAAGSFKNKSEALRDLVEFALNIKERVADNDSRTTREMLEELLIKEYQNEKTINQLYLFLLEPNKQFSSEHVNTARDNLKSHKENAIDRVEKYLARKE
ncbi:TPA: hypothetical protein ACX6QF_003947 [Photobacterium damselae]